MSKVKIQNSRQKIADILLKIGSVNINFKKQFTLTSGKKSPVYDDCRKLISYPKEREVIISEMSKQIKKKYKKCTVHTVKKSLPLIFFNSPSANALGKQGAVGCVNNP